MNLQEVVQTLIDGGLSEADIAKQIRVSQPTVHRIKHGADPAYTTGKRLEALHHKIKNSEVVTRTEHPAEN